MDTFNETFDSYSCGELLPYNKAGFKIAYRLARAERRYLDECIIMIERSYWNKFGMMFVRECTTLDHSFGSRTMLVCEKRLFDAVKRSYNSANDTRLGIRVDIK